MRRRGAVRTRRSEGMSREEWAGAEASGQSVVSSGRRRSNGAAEGEICSMRRAGETERWDSGAGGGRGAGRMTGRAAERAERRTDEWRREGRTEGAERGARSG